MSLKVYEYNKCSTCRKALKHLEGKKVEYKTVPIREAPPTMAELKKMLKHYYGEIKRLFNTSGQDYRQLNIKDKLSKLSEAELLKLLSENGNLVKRPFVLGKTGGVVGFKEDEWKPFLKAEK